MGDLLRAVTERPKDLVALSDRRAIKKGLAEKGSYVFPDNLSGRREDSVINVFPLGRLLTSLQGEI